MNNLYFMSAVEASLKRLFDAIELLKVIASEAGATLPRSPWPGYWRNPR
jgi:hypothetical protein